MMPLLAARHIIDITVVGLAPIGIAREKHKFSLGIDEGLYQPGAGYPIHFNLLARDPFHEVEILGFVGTGRLHPNCPYLQWARPDFNEQPGNRERTQK